MSYPQQPQPWQGPQGPYGYPPQRPGPYGPPPPQAPAPTRWVSVEKERGLGGGSHSIHLILTLCTFGLWGFVWLGVWLWRMVFPKRRRTVYRAR